MQNLASHSSKGVTKQFLHLSTLNIQRQSGLDCHRSESEFRSRRQNFGGVNLNGPRSLHCCFIPVRVCTELSADIIFPKKDLRGHGDKPCFCCCHAGKSFYENESFVFLASPCALAPLLRAVARLLIIKVRVL